jgi:flagellin
MLIDSSVDANCIVPIRMPIRKIQFVLIFSETVDVLHDCYALCQQYSFLCGNLSRWFYHLISPWLLYNPHGCRGGSWGWLGLRLPAFACVCVRLPAKLAFPLARSFFSLRKLFIVKNQNYWGVQMALPLNTNIDAMVAQAALTLSGQRKSLAIQRLGTGFRINAAKDDAAGLALADSMVAQVRGLTQARRNANDGISLAQTTEGALGDITGQLQRMREQVVQAANGENSPNLAAIQEEISQHLTEITRISTEASFNDIAVLSGTQDSVTFQTGVIDEQPIALALPKVDATTLGLDALDALDVGNDAGQMADCLARIDSACDQLKALLTTLGETQSRLHIANTSLGDRIADVATAFGLVKDADNAIESSNFVEASVLQQAGRAVLARANLQPAQILALLPGGSQKVFVIDTTDDRQGSISAQGENGVECKENLFDNLSDSKWLDLSPEGSWIQYNYAPGMGGQLCGYTLTSANDCPERDPSNWQLLGSNDEGASWDTVDTQTGVIFDERFQRRSFVLDGKPCYRAYRLNITQVADPSCANAVQLADMELLGQQVQA